MAMAIANVLKPDFGSRTSTGSELSQTQSLDTGQFALPVALVATRDSEAAHWAPRWLERAGVMANLVGDSVALRNAIAEEQPDILIVDAGLADTDGKPLLPRLIQSVPGTPIMALCANAKETRLALDTGADDIVRRPYDWQIVGRRARSLAGAHSTALELDVLRASLKEALARADGVKESLKQAARTDSVTGLPNRHKFRQLVAGALTGRTGQAAVLAVGIKRFGVINDALGHAAGNSLLAEVGKRIQAALADVALVPTDSANILTAAAGRLGGVRFGVLVNQTEPAQLRRVREKLVEHLGQPFSTPTGPVYLGVTIDRALAPRDASTADRLIQCAETALQQAKSRHVGFYQQQALHSASASRKLELERMLREAMIENQLSVAYQPLLDLSDGRIIGAEALLRWSHPEQGPISPAEFVPIAEDAGLMTPIGRFVIDTVCDQMRRWREAGAPRLRVAINISLCQLLSGDLVPTVCRALDTHGITPEDLELELSERGLMNQSPDVLAQLDELKALGVRLSVDDFGAGDTALSYLKDLPLDTLKIDRLYVSGELSTGREQAVARGLAAMGQSLNLTVIGEGVETQDQADMLRDWGCHECQGFLYAPALPADQFLNRCLS
jgi:diguanylate cyclase (GGDEF)-like protein